MFQFPWFASVLRQMIGYDPDRVSPFGHPRITGCVRLPLAFRSLPRPSSPLYTQASPVRFRSLDYISSSSKARACYLRNAFITLESVRAQQFSPPSPLALEKDFVSHDLPVPSLFKQRLPRRMFSRAAFNFNSLEMLFQVARLHRLTTSSSRISDIPSRLQF